MDYSDRRSAERVARALLALDLPKPLFRDLHHRTTLRDTEGVAEHVRWLQRGDASLDGLQKVLAERLHACLEAWFESGSWNDAASTALDTVPKS
jgi:hypothetical protein